MLRPIGCRRQCIRKGRASAQQILAQHLKEHGQYPETVAVMLGLDAIKTRGESLGILLELGGQNL